MVWLYTVVLLLEDITSVADFRDIVSLNTLKNKFLKDIKNDTDEGAAYLQECFLSLDTKKALNTFVITFYESALVFIMMHEIGHILELDDQTCEELNIISKQYLYLLENVDFTLFFAIYLMIYSIFTPILSQYFQFSYFFFFLFF